MWDDRKRLFGTVGTVTWTEGFTNMIEEGGSANAAFETKPSTQQLHILL